MNNKYEFDMQFRPIGWPFVYHCDTRTPRWPTIYSHFHTSIEILHIIEGAGSITSDGKAYDVKAGDIFIFNKESIHSITSPDTMRYHCLVLDADFCRQMNIPLDSVILQEKITSPALCELYDTTVAYITEKQQYSKALAIKSAIELFITLYRDYYKKEQASSESQKTYSSKSIQYVRDAISYIKKTLYEKITVEMLAEHLGVSKFHLCREFKKHTGDTIVSYANAIKCSQANKYILRGESISMAAHKVGFDNISYFTQVYKKYIGETPSDTAKRTRKKEKAK